MTFDAKRGEAVIRVAVGDGAIMTVPVDLEWHLRYGDPVKVRMQAAEAVASYDYLILHCSSAWLKNHFAQCRVPYEKLLADILALCPTTAVRH